MQLALQVIGTSAPDTVQTATERCPACAQEHTLTVLLRGEAQLVGAPAAAAAAAAPAAILAPGILDIVTRLPLLQAPPMAQAGVEDGAAVPPPPPPLAWYVHARDLGAVVTELPRLAAPAADRAPRLVAEDLACSSAMCKAKYKFLRAKCPHREAVVKQMDADDLLAAAAATSVVGNV